jgi:hypothetical protein
MLLLEQRREDDVYFLIAVGRLVLGNQRCRFCRTFQVRGEDVREYYRGIVEEGAQAGGLLDAVVREERVAGSGTRELCESLHRRDGMYWGSDYR